MNGVFLGPTPSQLKMVEPRIWGRPKDLRGIRDLLPILAIDPGGTTGWSFLVLPQTLGGKDVFGWPFDTVLKNKISWVHGEIDCHDEDLGSYRLMKLFDEWPTAAIVIEDFILRDMRREKSRELLSPVRITAKLEHHLWRSKRKAFFQQPSLAKTTVTDERLKIWGCYVWAGGQGHARDADRHALTFLRRCYGAQGFPIKYGAWPHIYKDRKDLETTGTGA